MQVSEIPFHVLESFAQQLGNQATIYIHCCTKTHQFTNFQFYLKFGCAGFLLTRSHMLSPGAMYLTASRANQHRSTVKSITALALADIWVAKHLPLQSFTVLCQIACTHRGSVLPQRRLRVGRVQVQNWSTWMLEGLTRVKETRMLAMMLTPTTLYV